MKNISFYYTPTRGNDAQTAKSLYFSILRTCTPCNGFPSVDTLPVVTVPGTDCTDGRWVSQAHEPELPKIPMLIFFGRTERKSILFFFTHLCAAMTPHVSRT